ncbi:nuclear transport factor 2 family protein [Janthinobacterium sp.]|uniref:nuclear transport factor 2 family protein n=1 Tax=Janthinobacterium sp. TaxID=1871054 RepID=UPI00261F3583|nr:nuclear transport factor 2 family protein [Janthinobacterium sp.]
MHTFSRKLAMAIAFASALCAATPALAASNIDANDMQEIRALFLRQAAAATAHDIGVIDSVLAHAAPGQPDPVSFIARAYQFWGRAAVLEHFRTTFQGTWVFEPQQDAIRITPLGPDTAQIYAPTRITLGAAGQPARQETFLMYETAIRTPQGWRIATMAPVPAQ